MDKTVYVDPTQAQIGESNLFLCRIPKKKARTNSPFGEIDISKTHNLHYPTAD